MDQINCAQPVQFDQGCRHEVSPTTAMKAKQRGVAIVQATQSAICKQLTAGTDELSAEAADQQTVL